MLSMLSLFSDLNTKELDYLSLITEEVSFQRGETIFSQGGLTRDFYIIKHGQVEISVTDIFKEKKVLSILKNGEFFGEMALFEKESTRSASAVAFQNTALYKIPGREFEKLLKEQPTISYKLLGTMSKRLRDAIMPSGSNKIQGQAKKNAKIVTIASARGGYGKTTMATTMASILANELPRRVLYLDLDLSFGDGTFLMGVYSPRSIVDFAQSFETDVTTEENIMKYVVKRMGGLNVMPAPKDIVEGEKLRGEDLIKVINSCKKHFDYIVIDTNSSMSENFLNAIDMADYLFFLIDCRDSIAIKSNSNFFKAFSRLNPPESHINLLMSYKSRGLNLENFKKIFKWRIIGELPEIPGLKMETDKMPYAVDPSGDYSNTIRLIAKETFKEETLKITSDVGFLARWFSRPESSNTADVSQGVHVQGERSLGADLGLTLNADYGHTILKEIRNEMHRGMLEKAQQDCLQLFNLFPSSPGILQILGEIYFLKKDFASALDVMNKVLTVDPDNHVALAHVAHITGNQEMKQKALQVLTSLMKDKPDYPDLLNDMGRVYFSFGEFSRAREFFEKSLLINPQYNEARINLSITLSEMNMTDHAIRHLIQMNPKNVRIYYHLADNFYKSGRFFDAMAAYNKVASIDPEYFDTHERLENLSDYFAKLENLLELHKRLASNSPDYPDIHFKMGNLYILVGKRQEAIAEFQTAIRLKPGYVEAQRKLDAALNEPSYDMSGFLIESKDGAGPSVESTDSPKSEAVSKPTIVDELPVSPQTATPKPSKAPVTQVSGVESGSAN